MSVAILGNTALSRFDAIVIGGGAGGGAVANMLCAGGQSVLVLEAGPNHFDGLDDPGTNPVSRFSNDELKLTNRNFIWPDPRVDPRTWRTDEADGDRTYVGDVNALPRTLGGGAVHADLKMPRFQPDDFHLGTLLPSMPGASFADWPVDYDMLEPFYLYIERLIGIQGEAGSDPFAGPRSAPFPMPPGVPMYCALKVAKGLTSLGYHPFPYPTAVNSRPYLGRPPCVDCGYCSGYVCPSNAKGGPPVTTLRRALLTRRCLIRCETRVIKLLVNGAGSEITGVLTIGPDGKRRTYSADRYVLAASPIEDARLLLLSGGIGDSSGQVGRNLTFHFQTGAVGIFDERVHGHRGRTVTHGFSDFRGVPGDPGRPLGGIVEISGSELPIEEASRYASLMKLLGGFRGPLFKKMMRQSPGRDHIVALALQAEDAPQPTNRVDLDPAVVDLDGLPAARVTYKNHAFELSAREHYAPLLIEVLAASGARFAFVAPADEIPGSAHIMGTLRFGEDPKTSVCDRNGRFHDVGNLFAADGALFPTASGFNPTHTIMSLATRVAAAMIDTQSPESVLDDPMQGWG